MKGFNLDILEKTTKRHHDALWNGERLFTQWLGVILTIQTALMLSKIDYTRFFFSTLIFSLLGIFLSIVAITSIRNEGEYFKGAFDSLKNAYRKLYRENIYSKMPSHNDLSLPDLLFFWYIQPFKTQSIKNLFQSLWAAFCTIFTIILVFSSVEFLRQWRGVGSENVPYVACMCVVTVYLFCGLVILQTREKAEEKIETPQTEAEIK